MGLVGNCADVLPEMAERGVVPDVVTDQTCSRSVERLCAERLTLDQAIEFRKAEPEGYIREFDGFDCESCPGDARAAEDGLGPFDYGNNIRTLAFEGGVKNAYELRDSFLPTFVRCSAKAEGLFGGLPFR